MRARRLRCLRYALVWAALPTGVHCERSASGPAGGNPLWLNEPAGFRAIEDQSWASLGSWSYDLRGTAHPAVVTNQDGPLSRPSALEFRYPRGMTGGGNTDGLAPGHIWFNITPSRYDREIFVAFWFKVSSNFYGHSTGVNKLAFLPTHADGHTDLWIMISGSGTDALGAKIQGEMEGLDPQTIEPNVTNGSPDPHPGETPVVISRGVWHKYEVYLKLPSASGQPGTVKTWVDGTLALNRTDFPMSFDGNNGWLQLQYDPIWGGTGDAKLQDDYTWFDHTYVSGP